MAKHAPLRPGHFYPLGATFDGYGVNFALFSETAEAVELCLFDESGVETRVPLPHRTLHVFHGYLPDVVPGQRYGYRVYGPYDPPRGLRFNPYKLLVDPYARAFSGKLDVQAPIFAYARYGATARDERDDAFGVPKSVVIDDVFDWEHDEAPEVPWADTVLYELHVKGFTKLHPDVPEHERGTFLGVGSEAAITHLKTLGVTAVELLPVHEAVTEPMVAARGLTNYWGYNTLGFFAPDQRFAARGPEPAGAPPGTRQVHEFKQMVKRLHAAGIEVILDVVYNHTCEGDHLGPTLGFRGIDNATYYRLSPEDRAKYQDYTGCGNTMNVAHPQTLKLMMDSLRYWVTEMHVDGFRFDLASALGRDVHAVDRLASFFDIVHQDPVLSRIKLIAEPWDLGEGGYQIGNFPLLWCEWNGRFRDTVRRFWLGRSARDTKSTRTESAKMLGDLGYRLTGSSDLFGDDGRHPYASINFVTAHDGFTLRDLVSYEKKHNEANGEGNRDGWDDNANWNSGAEGETGDPKIAALRMRQIENVLATLVLSQGVPMLSMGDEIGRTQRGNNNAYCQDNPISWVDWSLAPHDGIDPRAILAFAQKVLALRRGHPAFRRREFFSGRAGEGGLKDIAWYRPDGREMVREDWDAPKHAALALLLVGDAMAGVDEHGEVVKDDRFLMLLSAEDTPLEVTLPPRGWVEPWEVAVETGETAGVVSRAGKETIVLAPRSFVLLRSRRVA